MHTQTSHELTALQHAIGSDIQIIDDVDAFLGIDEDEDNVLALINNAGRWS